MRTHLSPKMDTVSRLVLVSPNQQEWSGVWEKQNTCKEHPCGVTEEAGTHLTLKLFSFEKSLVFKSLTHPLRAQSPLEGNLLVSGSFCVILILL